MVMSLLASRLPRSRLISFPPPAALFTFLSSSPSYSSRASTRILTVGDTLKLRRSFSAADVEDYSRVIGVCHSKPVNPDAHFAPIVHGFLVASLFPTLLASHFPGAIYISKTMQLEEPVYAGEVIVAETQVVELSKNRNRFIAKFQAKCAKEGGQLVVGADFRVILPTLSYKE